MRFGILSNHLKENDGTLRYEPATQQELWELAVGICHKEIKTLSLNEHDTVTVVLHDLNLIDDMGVNDVMYVAKDTIHILSNPDAIQVSALVDDIRSSVRKIKEEFLKE